MSTQFDPDVFHTWDPKTQARAAKTLRDRLNRPPRIWYCQKGRTCDGQPHDGADYKHARGDQWPPAGHDWLTWVLRGGRGSGKTRSGAEWVRKVSNRTPRIAVVAPTGPDFRATCIEGVSGLEYVCRRAGVDYDWRPSAREFHFDNGCIATGFSAEEPDRLRGPQHGYVWVEEAAHMPNVAAVWNNILFGLRMGTRPRACITTTPRPTKWMKNLLGQDDTIDIAVSSYANRANLADTYVRTILARYENTRLGRQELHGEILEDIAGALWTWDMIEDHRVGADPDRHYDKIVVAVDPAGTANRRSDETGIVVAARTGEHYYPLADASGRYSPHGWGSRVVDLYDHFAADAIVAETNYGADMVRSNLANVVAPDTPPYVIGVRSRRGKLIRATPVVSLYERHLVHHAADLVDLENQITSWIPPGAVDEEGIELPQDPDQHDDRLDALVHALTYLSGGGGRAASYSSLETIDTPLRDPRVRRLASGLLIPDTMPA